MPYRVRKQGENKFVIQVNHGGKWQKAGESTTREKAEASMLAKESFGVEQGLIAGVSGSTNPYVADANLTILGSYLFITIYQRRSIDSYMLFNVLICITSLSQWHYLICIIDEITDILSIRVFRVKPKVAPATP